MSDLMLTAVLSMPYDMAMADDLSRRQFYDRAQQALEVIERLTAERDAFAKEAEENKMRVITCGVAAEHSDANLTRTGAYAKKWDSAQAESVRGLRAERDELRRQLAEAGIAIDPDKWPAIRNAIERMLTEAAGMGSDD